jgi:hypothetical protein
MRNYLCSGSSRGGGGVTLWGSRRGACGIATDSEPQAHLPDICYITFYIIHYICIIILCTDILCMYVCMYVYRYVSICIHYLSIVFRLLALLVQKYKY